MRVTTVPWRKYGVPCAASSFPPEYSSNVPAPIRTLAYIISYQTIQAYLNKNASPSEANRSRLYEPPPLLRTGSNHGHCMATVVFA